jgi:hypothetical protein
MIHPSIVEEEGVSPLIFQTNSLSMASNSLRLLLKFRTGLTCNSTVHYMYLSCAGRFHSRRRACTEFALPSYGLHKGWPRGPEKAHKILTLSLSPSLPPSLSRSLSTDAADAERLRSSFSTIHAAASTRQSSKRKPVRGDDSCRWKWWWRGGGGF